MGENKKGIKKPSWYETIVRWRQLLERDTGKERQTNTQVRESSDGGSERKSERKRKQN